MNTLTTEQFTNRLFSSELCEWVFTTEYSNDPIFENKFDCYSIETDKGTFDRRMFTRLLLDYIGDEVPFTSDVFVKPEIFIDGYRKVIKVECEMGEKDVYLLNDDDMSEWFADGIDRYFIKPVMDPLMELLKEKITSTNS
jgi:hypothetical protein